MLNPWRQALCRYALLVGLVPLLSSCMFVSRATGLGTKVTRSFYFAVQDGEFLENINFYRVDITFLSTDGESKFVSGWHDREAFDSLGTMIGLTKDTQTEGVKVTRICLPVSDDGNTSGSEVLTHHQDIKVALRDQQDRIQAKLAGPDFATQNDHASGVPKSEEALMDDFRLLKKRMRLLYLGANNEIPGETAIDMIDHADKRLVYIFSTNPGDIERRIQMAVESEAIADTFNQITGAMVVGLADEVEEEAYEAKASLDDLERLVEGLRPVADDDVSAGNISSAKKASWKAALKSAEDLK